MYASGEGVARDDVRAFDYFSQVAFLRTLFSVSAGGDATYVRADFAREADIDRKYFRKLMKKYDIEAAGVDDDGDAAD